MFSCLQEEARATGSLTKSQGHLVWEVITWLHIVARGLTDTVPSPSLVQRGPIVTPASLTWHKGPWRQGERQTSIRPAGNEAQLQGPVGKRLCVSWVHLWPSFSTSSKTKTWLAPSAAQSDFNKLSLQLKSKNQTLGASVTNELCVWTANILMASLSLSCMFEKRIYF